MGTGDPQVGSSRKSLLNNRAADAAGQQSAEEALRESELRFRQLAEHIREVFWITSADGHEMIYVSPAYEAIWGRTCESLYADPAGWLEAIHSEDRPRVAAEFFAKGAHGGFDETYRIVRPDGTVRWIRDRGFPVRDGAGEVYRIAGIAEDVSERKRVEHELAANAAALARSNAEISRINAFLDSIVENVPNMLFVKDAETLTFERINRAGEELLGTRRHALLGKSDYDLFPPEVADFFIAKDREVLSNKQLLDIPEEVVKTKHGERILHTKKIPIQDEHGTPKYLLGISEDITARKRAEEALKEREEQLHRAVVEAPFPIMIHAEDGEVRLISRAWTDLSGYSQDEIPTVARWTELAYGQRKELVDQDIERLYGLTERVDEGEYEISTKEGGKRTWHFSSAPLGRLADGRRIVISMAMDITERKRAEVALAEHGRDLARSNAELEQFAYVASHDLQEPLRMVASYLQLLERRYKGKLDADADEFIHFAVDGATRMQGLINDLLTYSRVGTTSREFAPTACDDVLDEVLANMAAAIDEHGATVTREKLPIVAADRTQLVQLFQNLIGNAIKFRRDDPPIVHVSAHMSGSEWIFAVRDNGIGIDKHHHERIFQIFQRLHGRKQYPGTGIGLALCKRIVERHQGRIWVESHQAKGSVFYFTIPQHAGSLP